MVDAASPKSHNAAAFHSFIPAAEHKEGLQSTSVFLSNTSFDVEEGHPSEEEEEGAVARESLADLMQISVPHDCDLKTALDLTSHSCGKCIVLNAGEHIVPETIEIRARDFTIRGAHTDSSGGEKRPLIRGKFVLCKGSSGSLEGLDFTSSIHTDGVLSNMGGFWTLRGCSLKCGVAPTFKAQTSESSSRAVFRDFDVALHCGGGKLSALNCKFGGFDNGQRAYFGAYVTRDAKFSAEECKFAFCYGSAIEVRNNAQVRLSACEVKRNECAFSAGFPNEATVELTRNRIYKNAALWRKCPPSDIKDSSDNTDGEGYFVSVFPDI